MPPFDTLAGKKPIARQPRVRSQRAWFSTLFRLRGSVIPAVMPRVLCCVAFGLLVSILHQRNWPVSLPMLSGIVPSIVLGLLLVFRTNTAYERFWEGRKLWGTMVNVSRNLARQIWVAVEVKDNQERAAKQQALRLVAAFSVATKLWLRKPSVNAPSHTELQALLTPEHYKQLQVMNHPPLEIAFWLGDYLQQQQSKRCISPYQLIKLLELLDQLVNVLGGCERILKTPIPMAYSIHIKQLLLLYCLALPFQVVSDLGGWTAAIVGLVSFTVFGIEEIGIEIENPFGCDPNDLPLDEICQTMQRNIEDLMMLKPGIEGG
ncbi:MAG: bestrophin family ion channel [Cyanobacteria bacterium P01_G01_bin.38]